MPSAKRLDDVTLHSSSLVLVRDDAPAFEAFPERPSVVEGVSAWGFLSDFLALATGDLPGLHEGDFRPMTDRKIGHATAVADPKYP